MSHTRKRARTCIWFDTMFKRLSKASAHREQVDNDEEYVPLDAALDDDSQSEEEQADSEEEEDDSDEDEEDETALTVAHAMESPIYMDDEQPESPYRFRCVACPIVLLKSEKSIDVHLESKNHKRRHARFVAFAKTEMEREGAHVMRIDPRTLVDLLEDQRAMEAKQARQEVPTKRKRDTSHVPRVERRKMRRAVRRERRELERKTSA